MGDLIRQDAQGTNGRPRSRIQTAADLLLAIAQLKASNQRISISAVAATIGVTPALIHNKYPDIAESIRRQVGKSYRAKQSESKVQLTQAKATIRELRKEIGELEDSLQKLASINEALRRQLAETLAIANARNIVPISLKGG